MKQARSGRPKLPNQVRITVSINAITKAKLRHEAIRQLSKGKKHALMGQVIDQLVKQYL
jgi:hypothetical protein